MGTDSNGHAERLGTILLQMGWPTSKEQAAKCKQEVERTQAELDWDAKLKRINSLAFELQVLVKMRQFGAERQRYQLSEVAKKITEAAK